MKVGVFDIPYYTKSGYNDPQTNERKLELGFGKMFLDYHGHSIVEIGCVTPYYWDCYHVVYDLFDSHLKNIKKDVFDCDFTGQNVLSISTLEHVGSNDYGRYDIPQGKTAFDAVLSIVNNAHSYLITIPIGVNLQLDKSIAISGISTLGFIRNADNLWTQVPTDDSFWATKYGTPYHAANGVVILSNIGDLFYCE